MYVVENTHVVMVMITTYIQLPYFVVDVVVVFISTSKVVVAVCFFLRFLLFTFNDLCTWKYTFNLESIENIAPRFLVWPLQTNQ